MITSKDVEGGSRAAIVVLPDTLSGFGLPTTLVFLIRRFNVLRNRTRTTLYVIGNCTATVARTKGENAFDGQKATEIENKI